MRHKKMIQRIIAAFLAVIMVVTVPDLSVFATGMNQEMQIKPTAFEEEKTESQQELTFKNGYLPMDLDVSRRNRVIVVDGKNNLNLLSGQPVVYENELTIPSAYSSASAGYVTPVKDQGIWGTCWSFAACAAMESYALSHNLPAEEETVDFSEYALAYLTYMDETYREQTGDYTTTTDEYFGFNLGGNDAIAFKALTKWAGIYNEAGSAYANSIENEEVTAFDPTNAQMDYVLTGQYYISMVEPEQVKAAVLEYGAAVISYYSDDAFQQENHRYIYTYDETINTTNHAVTLVGWDDTMPRENFSIEVGDATYIPENDGAWLVKNSWGTECGDEGYCWISYEDVSLQDGVAVVYSIAKKAENNYDVLYQHDGATPYYYMLPGQTFANVFTNESENVNEINAISFGVYQAADVTYTVSIYKNPQSDEPTTGTLVTTENGTIGYDGYYTVELTEPITIEKDESFAIVVSFETEVALVCGVTDYLTNGTETIAYSNSNAGESYCLYEETWMDYGGYVDEESGDTGANFCIKAFANEVQQQTPQAPNAPQVELVSTNPMTLSWEAVEGAIGYRVYRAEVNTEPDVEEGNDEENQEEGMEEPQESQEGDEEPQEPQEEYVPLTSLTEETTYTDTTAEYQKEYKYYVTAYILDEEEMLESDAGNIVSGMKDVPVVSDFEVNDLNHGEITLTWEMNEHAVLDGYLIYALIATENEGEVEGENNEPQRVLIADITNITLSAYGHDVSTYEAGTKITYQVCPYVIVDDTKLESLTAPIERAAVVRKEALEADVQWYVQATIDSDYLVIEIDGDVETDYCIYITDEDGDTITEVIRDISYESAESGVQLISLERPFDQKCYFYIVDEDELCGIQEEPFCVGGAFVEPQLENISNVAFENIEETHILQTVITNPMEGFKYTYQWYVKDSIGGRATAIEGANDSTYEVGITSEYELKYYYCVVSCEFRVKMEYSTQSANDLPTYVCGPSLGTNVVVAPIEALTYSGIGLEPEVVITEGDRTLIKDEDYLISYNNNVNAGQEAEVVITFINAYAHVETRSVYFIINPYPAAKLTCESIEDQIYTGEPIEPEIIVKHGDIILKRGVDYTVDYRSNTNIGRAMVYIRFKGNYTGTRILTFEIIKPIPSQVTSENHTVDEATGYISKITAGTTVATFKGAINERDYVAIFKEGIAVEEDALLGTGMNVNIMDGEEVKKSYTIIVTGDTNGDGKINITDMIAVKASTLKKSNLTGAYEKAADVNGDGKINITDFIKVKAAILGKDTIVGVSVAE